MIKFILYKPKCFEHLPDDTCFWAFIQEDEIVAYVGMQILDPAAHFHIEYLKFNATILKRTVSYVWPQVKQYAVERGCTTFVASKESKTEEEFLKWERFIKHLGFAEPKTVHIATLEAQHGN